MNKAVLLSFVAVVLSACAFVDKGPVGNALVPQPAKAVELNRYLGVWYEGARYEAWFQRGCEAVMAEYSLREDGDIRVVNSCHKGGVAGEVKSAEARAYVVAGSDNAKLRVSFFWPFFGDYWVLDHADDYAWSIVGEPSGRFLWLLFRTPHPSAQQKAAVEQRAAQMGFDLGLLRQTAQP